MSAKNVILSGSCWSEGSRGRWGRDDSLENLGESRGKEMPREILRFAQDDEKNSGDAQQSERICNARN
jgi:hypothetical protein